MEPKTNRWPQILLLLVGMWLLLGRPMPGTLIPGSSAPFPADGLRVLVIEDTKQILEPARETALLSVGKTTRDAGGKYRIVQVGADLSRDKDWVQAAGEVEHGPPPWIIISNGKSGANETLPESAAAVKELITKYK